MKNCCNHTSTDTQCTRQSDGKVFDLPRKYSRKRCRNPKGFTMKSSCAPYKDCYKNKHKHKHKHKNKTRKQKTQKKQRGSGNKTRRRRDNTRKVTRKTRKRKQTAGAETDARAETDAPDPGQSPSPESSPESSPEQPPSTAPEPRLSWEEMLPKLAKRMVNPLDCIAAQWLTLKTKLSKPLESLLKGTIESIEEKLDDQLGKDGIYQYIKSDDFYTKWAVGGVGHASAVILSDLLDFLPGAGTVGMVHQFATDKIGAALANSKTFQKATKMLRGKLIDDLDILTEKLISIKKDWLASLPPNKLKIYENAKFLDDDMPVVI